jgi:hypothetical protein
MTENQDDMNSNSTQGQKFGLLIGILVFIGSIIWFFSGPAFEPLLVILGAISGLVTIANPKGRLAAIAGTIAVVAFTLGVILVFEVYIPNPTLFGSEVPLTSTDSNSFDNLPLYSQVTLLAWNAQRAGDHALTIAITETCIANYEALAIKTQQGLTEDGVPLPGSGSVTDEERNLIFSYGVLNEVASCYWIRGQVFEELESIDEAKGAYLKIQQFPHARVWDPQGQIFWAPVQNATERLNVLQ